MPAQVTPAIRPEDSAQAARTPGQAAAGATCAARAGNAGDDAAAEAEPAAAATPAAANSAARAASAPTAATSATAAATVTTAATAASAGQLHAARANVFLVEEIERGETDVGHFLFAKNEALIGRGIAGLRDVDRGRRGSGCATDQRQPQSGSTQHLDAASLPLALLYRSLLDS